MNLYLTALRPRRFFLVILAGVAFTLVYSQPKPKARVFRQAGFVPKEGFVPNGEVAKAIAEAVLSPVYGKETVISERPFKVKLDGDIWVVSGSVPCVNPPPGATCPGGSAEVRISKKTGQILYMTHSQ
jgi:hypothetical protein